MTSSSDKTDHFESVLFDKLFLVEPGKMTSVPANDNEAEAPASTMGVRSKSFPVVFCSDSRRHSIVTGVQDFHDGLFGPDLVKDEDNDKQLDKPLFQLAREGDIESMQAVLSR